MLLMCWWLSLIVLVWWCAIPCHPLLYAWINDTRMHTLSTGRWFGQKSHLWVRLKISSHLMQTFFAQSLTMKMDSSFERVSTRCQLNMKNSEWLTLQQFSRHKCVWRLWLHFSKIFKFFFVFVSSNSVWDVLLSYIFSPNSSDFLGWIRLFFCEFLVFAFLNSHGTALADTARLFILPESGRFEGAVVFRSRRVCSFTRKWWG